MTQTSDIGNEGGWGWPCPYCRGSNPDDATTCAHCGAQLRDPEDDLFTTVAADNAEVVPPERPFGRDNMWSTDASAPAEGELVEEPPPPPASGPWDPATDVVSGLRSSFSADPAARPDDVVDEPFHPDEPYTGPGQTRPLLFSNESRADFAGEVPGAGRSPFAAPAGDSFHAAAAAPVGPPPVAPVAPVAPAAPADTGQWAAPHPGPPPVPDAHGLAAAVGRLRVEDQERAAAPIAVCGALLQRDEVVLCAVTGQMLGQAAVVVLTTQRVLVVNARRWQPIVDVFPLGPDLVARGRHDRDVAALSFSDAERLSTVDNITEVALAVELAERVRPDGS
ncbi:MAG: hypothetical protein ACOYOP_04680 [Microthrixaceae bacterium]